MIGPVQRRCSVVETVRLARDTYRLRLHAPDIAGRIRPGQFVMLRLPDRSDPLLGRPFALYDTTPSGHCLDIVYLVVGKFTAVASVLSAAETLEVWGPLGNGFRQPPPGATVTLVAGGIGQTPFLAYAQQLLGRRGYGGEAACATASTVRLAYGARSADLLAGCDDFRAAGVELHLATDDGSAGYHGYVTGLLTEQPTPDLYVGCGPEPMLKALTRLASERGVACDVSLETPMACGLGICYSCVAKVKCATGWDYQRVCVEGPVFDAARIVWP